MIATDFPIVSSLEEEKGTDPGKIRSQVPDRWAGAGRDVGPGRDGPVEAGVGPGRAKGGGEGTCVFLHKYMRRNRLKCRFGAEY